MQKIKEIRICVYKSILHDNALMQQIKKVLKREKKIFV